MYKEKEREKDRKRGGICWTFGVGQTEVEHRDFTIESGIILFYILDK